MMKGFSAQTELIIIVILFCVTLGVVSGACGNPFEGDPSARDKAEEECEVAYEEGRDGDDDDPEAIVNEPWCQEHNAAEEQIADMEREQELLEAREDLAEAQPEVQQSSPEVDGPEVVAVIDENGEEVPVP